MQSLSVGVGEQEKWAPCADVAKQIHEQIARFQETKKAYEEDLRRAHAFSVAHSTSAGSSAAS
eukprot:6316177-Alexandrium_andersonii.AAC.1